MERERNLRDGARPEAAAPGARASRAPAWRPTEKQAERLNAAQRAGRPLLERELEAADPGAPGLPRHPSTIQTP